MADLANNYWLVVNEETKGVMFLAAADREMIAEAESMSDEEACTLPCLATYIEAGLKISLIHKDAVAEIKAAAPESRKQIYWNGSELAIDTEWNNKVMPDRVIRARAITKKEAAIAAELAKEEPDSLALTTMSLALNEYQVNKPRDQHSIYWLEKGLEGLDERVSENEGDKPAIREKIAELMAALEGE